MSPPLSFSLIYLSIYFIYISSYYIYLFNNIIIFNVIIIIYIFFYLILFFFSFSFLFLSSFLFFSFLSSFLPDSAPFFSFLFSFLLLLLLPLGSARWGLPIRTETEKRSSVVRQPWREVAAPLYSPPPKASHGKTKEGGRGFPARTPAERLRWTAPVPGKLRAER